MRKASQLSAIVTVRDLPEALTRCQVRVRRWSGQNGARRQGRVARLGLWRKAWTKLRQVRVDKPAWFLVHGEQVQKEAVGLMV